MKKITVPLEYEYLYLEDYYSDYFPEQKKKKIEEKRGVEEIDLNNAKIIEI